MMIIRYFTVFFLLFVASNVHASGMDPGLALVLLIAYGLPYVYGGVISVVCLVIGLVLKFKGRSGRVLFVFSALLMAMQIIWNFYSGELFNSLDDVGNGNPPIFTDKKKYSHCSSDILGITEDKSIVLFTAKWSGPDRKLRPIINDLLNSYSTITLYVMDVDEKRAEAKLCNITGMPTLLYFNSGVIRGVSKGLMPKEELERYFKEYL